jgi:hypothetical protein
VEQRQEEAFVSSRKAVLAAAAFVLATLIGVVLAWPSTMLAINLRRLATVEAAKEKCDTKLASLGLPSADHWTLPTLEVLNDVCHPEIVVEFDNEALVNVCMLGLQRRIGWRWCSVTSAGLTVCEKLFWYY